MKLQDFCPNFWWPRERNLPAPGKRNLIPPGEMIVIPSGHPVLEALSMDVSSAAAVRFRNRGKPV